MSIFLSCSRSTLRNFKCRSKGSNSSTTQFFPISFIRLFSQYSSDSQRDLAYDIDSSTDSNKKFAFVSNSFFLPSKSTNVKLADYINGAEEKRVFGGGEDSFFTSQKALAVADGVGGWIDIPNSNSALFSRLMMHYLLEQIDTFTSRKNQSLDTQTLSKLLKISHLETVRHKVLGSTTVCALAIDGEEIYGINVGDSGFLLIRNGKIFLKSVEQIWAFNSPYQLGPDLGITYKFDTYKAILKEGDTVVLFTDGVSDNMFDQEVVEILEKTTFENAAQEIALKAKEFSFSNRESPFEMAAKKHKIDFKGGKPDDITVVVGKVVVAT